MNATKRVNKGYKVKDSYYQKAKKRASKNGGSLVQLIECVVIAYAEGMNIVATNVASKKLVTLDEVVASDLLSEFSKK